MFEDHSFIFYIRNLIEFRDMALGEKDDYFDRPIVMTLDSTLLLRVVQKYLLSNPYKISFSTQEGVNERVCSVKTFLDSISLKRESSEGGLFSTLLWLDSSRLEVKSKISFFSIEYVNFSEGKKLNSISNFTWGSCKNRENFNFCLIFARMSP